MITPKDLYLVTATILFWATAIFSTYVLVNRPVDDAPLITFQTEVLQEASSALQAQMAYVNYRIDQQLDDLASYRLRTLYAPQAQAAAARTLFLDPANVRLVVGTDTIAFGENGLAEVPLSTKRRGRQTEGITLVITNPLTGEVRKSMSEFSWLVH